MALCAAVLIVTALIMRGIAAMIFYERNDEALSAKEIALAALARENEEFKNDKPD